MEWIGLTLKKIRYFWNRAEISNNQPIRFFAERYAPTTRYLPIGFGIIAPLSLLGLILCFGNTRRFFPLIGFVIIYSLSVIMFFVCTRFKMPVMPMLIILACGAVQWLARAFKSRRWIKLSLGTAVLVPLFWWVNDTAEGFERQDHWGFEILGKCELEKGNPDEAIMHFKDGLQSQPIFPASLYFNLGFAYLQKEALDEAETEFRRGLESKAKHKRDFAHAFFGLAYIAKTRGETDEAFELFRRAIRYDPRFVKPHLELGKLLVIQRKIEDGITEIEIALKLDPDNIHAWVCLADASTRLGRPADAVRALEEALSRMRPDDLKRPILKGKLQKIRRKLKAE